MPNTLPKNRIWLSSRVSEPAFDETGQLLFSVGSGDGRSRIVRQSLATGLAETITAEPAPAATVGYGGGVFAVRGGLLAYAAKGRLVVLDLETGEQRTVTPQYEGLAAPALSPDGRFVAFVIEQDGHADVLVTDTTGEQLPVRVTRGPAFAANPTFSPDDARLAWMEWEARHMPWEQSTLQVATLARSAGDAGTPAELLPVAVETLARERVSYANPQFSPDGAHLAYTSDESGWRSLYVADGDGRGGERVETGTGEIGGPDWVQGQFAVRWGAGETLYAVRAHRATCTLIRVRLGDRDVEELASRYAVLSQLAVHPGEPDALAYLASSPDSPDALVTRRGDEEVARASTAVGIADPAGLAPSEVVEWPAVDGTVIYGVLTRARGGEGPRPAMVVIHGGPTSEAANGWSPQAQYFAGRGWHVLAVNHRGGTGAGRAYQDMLDGAWGVVDVEDARTGAQYLVEQGLADPERLVITGGSAGGYTTLMALTQDPELWTAGVSLYGIGNLYDLKQGSHRFEASYEETTVGPLPETAARWVERSPLTHVAQVRAPVLLFHGKEDTAVPYQQSVEFAEAVRRGGGVAELVLYDDEGHGFRKEANRRDQLERMEAFLEKYVINLQGRRPERPA